MADSSSNSLCNLIHIAFAIAFALLISSPIGSYGFTAQNVINSPLLTKKIATNRTIKVDINGNGEFTSIQAAVDAVPEGNSQWMIIHVRKGIYRWFLAFSLPDSYIDVINCSFVFLIDERVRVLGSVERRFIFRRVSRTSSWEETEKEGRTWFGHRALMITLNLLLLKSKPNISLLLELASRSNIFLDSFGDFCLN